MTNTTFTFLPATSELHYLKDKLVDAYLRLEYAENFATQTNIVTGERTHTTAYYTLKGQITKLERKVKAMERKANKR